MRSERKIIRGLPRLLCKQDRNVVSVDCIQLYSWLINAAELFCRTKSLVCWHQTRRVV
jgi:hypothetical protein